MTNEKLKIRRKRASLDARKARSGYFFVLPFILGIFLVYIPILLDSVWLSFGNINFNSESGLMEYTFDGIIYYK